MHCGSFAVLPECMPSAGLEAGPVARRRAACHLSSLSSRSAATGLPTSSSRQRQTIFAAFANAPRIPIACIPGSSSLGSSTGRSLGDPPPGRQGGVASMGELSQYRFRVFRFSVGAGGMDSVFRISYSTALVRRGPAPRPRRPAAEETVFLPSTGISQAPDANRSIQSR